MHDDAVPLTDFGLALLCASLALLAARWTVDDKSLRGWWVVFFASIGLGALLGGIVHGFFPEPGAANSALWKGTLLSIGITEALEGQLFLQCQAWEVGAAKAEGWEVVYDKHYAILHVRASHTKRPRHSF